MEIKLYNSVFALFWFLFLLYLSIRNASKNDKNAAIADHNSGDNTKTCTNSRVNNSFTELQKYIHDCIMSNPSKILIPNCSAVSVFHSLLLIRFILSQDQSAISYQTNSTSK